jgi:predicted secreted protein
MSLLTPTVTVTPSPTSITATQAVSVAVAVTGTGGTPTGTVKITSGSYSSSATVLAAGAATIVVPGSAIGVGSDTLTATYTPDVNSEGVYTSNTGTGTVTVTAVSLTPLKLQGYKAQLGYYPAGGGAMVIVAGLKELDGAFKAEELDATDHGNLGWKSRLLGLLDFEATAKLDYIAGDAGQEYLLNNGILASQPLTISLFPQHLSGSGIDAYTGQIVITDFKWNGKNNDLQGIDMTMKGNGPFTVTPQ